MLWKKTTFYLSHIVDTSVHVVNYPSHNRDIHRRFSSYPGRHSTAARGNLKTQRCSTPSIIIMTHERRAVDKPVEIGTEQKSLTKQVLGRSEEHTSELQSRGHIVCRLLLVKKNHHIMK